MPINQKGRVFWREIFRHVKNATPGRRQRQGAGNSELRRTTVTNHATPLRCGLVASLPQTSRHHGATPAWGGFQLRSSPLSFFLRLHFAHYESTTPSASRDTKHATRHTRCGPPCFRSCTAVHTWRTSHFPSADLDPWPWPTTHSSSRHALLLLSLVYLALGLGDRRAPRLTCHPPVACSPWRPVAVGPTCPPLRLPDPRVPRTWESWLIRQP